MLPSDLYDTEWVETRIRVHPVAHEALSAFLFDLGCSGLVAEESNNPFLKAYFPIRINLSDIEDRLKLFLENLKGIFAQVRSYKIHSETIQRRDWSSAWRQFFAPVQATPHLLILPVWERIPCVKKQYVIRIDPGPAFGTGQHCTTRMCLRAMEMLPLPESWTMMDVGTGSGILAIYGAMLGAIRIVGVDNDLEALRWARHTVTLNDLAGSIELSATPVEEQEGTFSLITANLTPGEIHRLLPNYWGLLASGGWLIVSGFLEEQIRGLERYMDEQGFVQEHRLSEKGWACVIASNSLNSRGEETE